MEVINNSVTGDPTSGLLGPDFDCFRFTSLFINPPSIHPSITAVLSKSLNLSVFVKALKAKQFKKQARFRCVQETLI